MIHQIGSFCLNQRCQNILNAQAFYKVDSHSLISFIIDSSDNFLTVHHRYSPYTFEFLFAESLALMIKSKNISDLWSMSSREIESFLREENHRAAFQDLEIDWKSIFRKVQADFLIEAYIVIKNQQLFHLKTYSQSNFVDKNLKANQICALFGWELILLKDDVLTVKVPTVEMHNMDLSNIVNEVNKEWLENYHLKVVAVI